MTQPFLGGEFWSWDQRDQLAALLRRAGRFVSGGYALVQALGKALSGGSIELDEGVFFIVADMTVSNDNVRIYGQGEKTVIYLVNGASILWTGDYGRLQNLVLDGVSTTGRSTGWLLDASGDHFHADELKLANAVNGMRLTGDYQHAVRNHVVDQTSVGVESTGDAAHLVGNLVGNGAAVNDFISSGTNAFVMGNRAPGGGILVSGVGSYAPAGSNWV